MKLQFKFAACIPLLLMASWLRAEEPTSEDVVELSSFWVGSDPDGAYRFGSQSGTRLSTAENSPAPGVPVTLKVRAESVAVQFVLRNDQEKPEIRNKELFDTVNELESAAKAADLRIEQREVRFTGGQRKVLSFSKGSSTSFVNLVMFAKLEENSRVADVVKRIRDVVNEKRLVGKTRVADGTVGLTIKNPGHHRNEILDRIFEDIERVKKGVGADFEVALTGLNKPVQLRPSGEGELELWIDYSFSINSIRVIQGGKK